MIMLYINIILNIFRTFSLSIMGQLSALLVLKPLVWVFLHFFSREASLCHSLYTRFIIAFQPDDGIRRTLYACTPNDVCTYTVQCTHVHRTTHVASCAKWQFRAMFRKLPSRCFFMFLKRLGQYWLYV